MTLSAGHVVVLVRAGRTHRQTLKSVRAQQRLLWATRVAVRGARAGAAGRATGSAEKLVVVESLGTVGQAAPLVQHGFRVRAAVTVIRTPRTGGAV